VARLHGTLPLVTPACSSGPCGPRWIFRAWQIPRAGASRRVHKLDLPNDACSRVRPATPVLGGT
jgi:hypothetical protein